MLYLNYKLKEFKMVTVLHIYKATNKINLNLMYLGSIL